MQGHLGNSQWEFYSSSCTYTTQKSRIHVTLSTIHKGRQTFLRLTSSSIKLFHLYSTANGNYTRKWIILHHHFIPYGSYCHKSAALRNNYKLINESKKHSLKVSLQILLLHSISMSWCLSDRASPIQRCKQPTKCHNFFFIYLFKSALHVSGDIYAHPQEHFLSVYTAFGTMHRHCCRPVHCTKSCIYRQKVLLRMGVYVARNM